MGANCCYCFYHWCGSAGSSNSAKFMFMGKVITTSTTCRQVSGTFSKDKSPICVMADGITADACSDVLGTWDNDQCIIESTSFLAVCAVAPCYY